MGGLTGGRLAVWCAPARWGGSGVGLSVLKPHHRLPCVHVGPVPVVIAHGRFEVSVADALDLPGHGVRDLIAVNTRTVAIVRACTLDHLGAGKHRLDVTATPGAHEKGRAAGVALVDNTQELVA